MVGWFSNQLSRAHFVQHLALFPERHEFVRRTPPVRRHGRYPRSRKVRIPHHEQAVQRRGRGGDRDRVRRLGDPSGAAVRSLVSSQKSRLRQRRPHHLHLHAFSHVRNRLLHRAPQHLERSSFSFLYSSLLRSKPCHKSRGSLPGV